MGYEALERSIVNAFKKNGRASIHSLLFLDNFEKDIDIDELRQEVRIQFKKKYNTVKILLSKVKQSMEAALYGDLLQTQALRGHGCFREYRYQICKIDLPKCSKCS